MQRAPCKRVAPPAPCGKASACPDHAVDTSKQGREKKADSTLRSSRAVPHPSTDRALRRLTAEVGRDPVHSTRYGRQRYPHSSWRSTMLMTWNNSEITSNPQCNNSNCWAEAPIKIARMTLTIKLDGNWSSFQLANSAPPLSVTDSAIAPSARIFLCRPRFVGTRAAGQ